MGKSNFAEQIRNKETYIGIEFGSTRIKAVLTGADHTPIASGSYDWENQYEDGIWTYHLDMIWRGLKECYRSLREEVGSRYGVELEGTKAIGISAMMHGYLAFDENGELLVPFRTWRNTITQGAADELTDVFQYNIPQYCSSVPGNLKSGAACFKSSFYHHAERISSLETDRRESTWNRRCGRNVSNRLFHQGLSSKDAVTV